MPLDQVLPWLEDLDEALRCTQLEALLAIRPELAQVPLLRERIKPSIHLLRPETQVLLRRRIPVNVAPDTVRIVPCAVRWSHMTPTDGVPNQRSCTTCEQTVTQVSSRAEAALYIGKGCVSIRPDADVGITDLFTATLSSGIGASTDDEQAPPENPPPVPVKPAEIPTWTPSDMVPRAGAPVQIEPAPPVKPQKEERAQPPLNFWQRLFGWLR